MEESITAAERRGIRGGGYVGLVALIVSLLISSLFPIPGASQTQWIYGLQGWFTIGDTLIFMGDAHLTTFYVPDFCDDWDTTTCYVDYGFYFRRARNVDVEACTTTAGDTCYVVATVCCEWVGACNDSIDEKHHSLSYLCDTAQGGEKCEDDGIVEKCGDNCYCRSIWEVKSFNATQGDAVDGCYKLELICDSDDELCENLCGLSSTVIKWWE
jgi:hypothetical protein